MKVSSTIKTYPEAHEKETQPSEVEVTSHWNDTDKVHLVFGRDAKTKLTVVADDLRRAIQNATNHR